MSLYGNPGWDLSSNHLRGERKRRGVQGVKKDQAKITVNNSKHSHITQINILGGEVREADQMSVEGQAAVIN